MIKTIQLMMITMVIFIETKILMSTTQVKSFIFFTNHNISRRGEDENFFSDGFHVTLILHVSSQSLRHSCSLSFPLCLSFMLNYFNSLSHLLSLSLSLSLSFSLSLSLWVSLSLCLSVSLSLPLSLSLSSSLSLFLFLSCLLTSIFHRIPSISWLQRQGPIVQYSFW